MKLKIGMLGAMLEEVSSIKEMMVVDRETSIAVGYILRVGLMI